MPYANPVDMKLNAIYKDFEANVVHVSNRKHLMWAVDMVYHSALSFRFQGEVVEKGVAELLVIGDTRTGKSKTIRGLMRHYGLGDYIQGEAVSLAGLLGGIDESKNQRFIRYGRLPQNHRGIVVIDEANEMSQELMGKLSGVRSSGMYDIVKIVGQKIPCLLRQVWIANTRTQKTLGEYSFGIESIPDLIGKPEDIARFDICVGIAQRDVDRDSLYRRAKDRAKVSHDFESRRCRDLILWAWSRKPDDIIISDAVESYILRRCRDLVSEFDDAIPLVVETELRIKVARLSVATAIRTLSTDENYQKVIVRQQHVKSAIKWLREIYNSQTLSYGEWSKQRSADAMGKEIKIVMKALGLQGMAALLQQEFVSVRDLKLLLKCDKEDAEEVLRLMLYGNAFVPSTGRRRLSGPMIDGMRAAINEQKLPFRPNINVVRNATMTYEDIDSDE